VVVRLPSADQQGQNTACMIIILPNFTFFQDLSAYNTRMFKKVDHATGRRTYEVKLASVETSSKSL
jgi:hypothetical protein